jgi:hypothetical protein
MSGSIVKRAYFIILGALDDNAHGNELTVAGRVVYYVMGYYYSVVFIRNGLGIVREIDRVMILHKARPPSHKDEEIGSPTVPVLLMPSESDSDASEHCA